MQNSKISLCLLVFNEIEGCKNDIPLLPRDEFDEIFAIDAGSTDGTVDYLISKNIKVYKQKNLGLNNAYIEANEISKNENIVVFFPKNTIDPHITAKFKRYFEENYELVIASRMLRDSKNEEDGKILKYRKWSNILLSNVVSLIWKKEGNKIKDILHGVKGWKKSSFKKMNILNYGLTIDLEMTLKSYKLNLKRIEFPVQEKYIKNRKTNFPYWSTGIKLSKYLFFKILGLN